MRLIKLIITPFNVIFLGIISIFALGVYIVTCLWDAPTYFTTTYYSQTLRLATIVFLVCFLYYRLIYIVFFVRPKPLLKGILYDFKTFMSCERLLKALPIIILMPFFFSLFTTAKNMIPIINPFSWDPFFSQLDNFIHFGKHPWEWLQPLIGFAIVSLFISFIYKLWFILKFSVIYWQAFTLNNSDIREQFFISLLLIWIVNGVILATIFASVGPCYYGLAYPHIADPYSALITYLHNVSIYDLQAQEFLWKAYVGQTPLPYSGISAMPSMHVSMACLIALLGWQFGGLIRWAYVIFLGFILIGSIHLGWHYAVDGYLSLMTTPILWVFSGKIIKVYRNYSIMAIPRIPIITTIKRKSAAA